MIRSSLLAPLLGLGVIALALTLGARADCAQSVEELTLELTSLESEDGAPGDEVERERARIGESGRLVGDFESPYSRLEEIWMEVGDHDEVLGVRLGRAEGGP